MWDKSARWNGTLNAQLAILSPSCLLRPSSWERPLFQRQAAGMIVVEPLVQAAAGYMIMVSELAPLTGESRMIFSLGRPP